MTGARELAGQVLDRNIRLGFPQPVTGMPEAARGPAFAVAGGLLEYALRPDEHTVALPDMMAAGLNGGYLARVGQWIRESF